ncbi:hypothetical protein [Bartonella raoultii]|uniref:hypothetical protein n=1 Tax=Bartonella raoultii TaxID=1457020 RepID=UPI001ABB2C2A|nr:hypothetical protein [Bartonella raoultii]
MNIPLHHQCETIEFDNVIVETKTARLLSMKMAQYGLGISAKLSQNWRKLYKP